MHQLGVGVLGPVFRGYPPDGDDLVALKAFHLELVPEQTSRFADALGKIVALGALHPSLVRPLDAGVTDGVPFVAYEYVAAESLDVASRQQAPVPVDTTLPLILQLAGALDAAHEQGLCHGALHLRDIFATHDLMKVSGFGVLSALEGVGLRGPLRRPFAAPEQVAGSSWGGAADRFALAAVSYELLTGKRSGGADSQSADQFAGIASGLHSLGLRQVFATALADDPDARPASARLFAEQLAEAVEWNGAGRVLGPVGVNKAEVDPESDQSSEPALVGAGAVSPHFGVAAGVGGSAMPKSNRRTEKFESESNAKLDWTERSLDRGLPDEFRQSEVYEPRPLGTPPGVEPPEESELDPDSDGDRLDLALANGGDDGVGDEGYLSALDAIGDRPEVSRAPALPDEGSSQVLETDASRGGDRADELADIRSRGGSLFEQFDEPDREPAAGQRHQDHGAASAVSPGDDISEVQGVAPVRDENTTEIDDAVKLLDAVESVDADTLDDPGLAAIQARYRLAADAEEGKDVSEGQGVVAPYEPITLRDLQERLGDDSVEDPDMHGRGEARVDEAHQFDGLDGEDEADDYIDETEDRLEQPQLSESDREAHADDQRFPLLADDAYGYHSAEDDPDASFEEIVDRPRGGRVRWLPLAATVCAVVLAFGAFGMGFRWMAGAGALGPDSSLPDESMVLDDAATSIDADGASSGSGFNEASVGSLTGRLAAVDPSANSSLEPLVARSSPRVEPLLPESENVEAISLPDPVVWNEPASSASSFAPEVSAPVGRLLVRSMPPGAQVDVDGDPRGTTPLALSDLAYGDYALRVSLEGYEPRNQQLLISPEDPIVALSVEFDRLVVQPDISVGVGSISVDTRPHGVQVWIDQRLVGETPMLIPDVSAGVHVVEFRQEGYRDWATTVRVGPSEQARVTASLDHVRP